MAYLPAIRKYFTIVASLALVLSCVPSLALASPRGEPSISAPSHHKSITDNKDGTYRLSLDVHGQKETSVEVTPVDVILIIDTSGSMKEVCAAENVRIGSLKYGVFYPDHPGTKLKSRHAYEIELNGKKTKVYYSNKNETFYTKNDNGYRDYSIGSEIKGYPDLEIRDNKATKTRLQAAQQASVGMIDAMLDSNEGATPENQIRISLISFDTNATTKQDFTTDQDVLNNKIYGLEAEGATNWDEALVLADAEIKEHGRQNAKKVIVFLSDGQPTVRINPMGFEGWKYDNDYDLEEEKGPNGLRKKNNVYGAGYADFDSNSKKVGNANFRDGMNYQAALIAANTLAKKATVYSVSTGTDEAKTRMSALTDDINRSNPTYPAEFLDGTSQSQLVEAFEDIAGKIITSYFFTEVYIQDALSENVMFADLGPDGLPTDITYETINAAGVVSPMENPPAAIVQDNKLVWNLGDFVLEKDTTYRVSFNVKPTQLAFDKQAEQKYDHEGGLFSNDNENTELSYSLQTWVDDEFVESEKGTVPYNKPFFKPATSKLLINKVWSDGAENHANDIVKYVVKRDGEDFFEGQLTKDNDWKAEHVIAAGPVGHEYIVSEIPVVGYEALVEVDQDDKDDQNHMVTFDFVGTEEAEAHVVFTNTANFGLNLTKYYRDENQQAVPLPDASFSLLAEDGVTELQTAITAADGTINFEGLKPGTYWLRETNVPSGFGLLDTDVKIEIVRTDNGGTVFNATRFKADGTTETQQMKTVDNKGVVGVIQIENTPLPDLPKTGSSGHLLLTLLGSILIVGGVYFIRKEKMAAQTIE